MMRKYRDAMGDNGMSVAGGAIGIAVGVTAFYAVGRVMEWPLAVTTNAVLLAFGFAVVIGVCFGFYPARKAAALKSDRRPSVRVMPSRQFRLADRRRNLCGAHGKSDDDGGATCWGTVDRNLAVVRFDEPLRGWQP